MKIELSPIPQAYTLKCDNDNLTYEQNCIIFKYVFDYIKCSKRYAHHMSTSNTVYDDTVFENFIILLVFPGKFW